MKIGLAEIVLILLVIIVPIIVFLVLRELVLWYWKVNTIVNNQTTEIKLLREILNELAERNKSNKL